MKPTMNRMSAVLLALSLALPLAGCDEETGSALASLQPVEGLTIRAYDGEGIEGSFTVDGATIEFSIEKDGATRSASITDAEGAPLLESSAAAGREVVTLLGGRAVLSGDPSGEPHVEGDEGAHEELVARPEGACIAGLHDALEQAGVDPVLLGAEAAPDELVSRLHDDGTYWNLSPNESILVGTWGWITYTHIGMRIGTTLSGPTLLWGCVRFQAGFGPWENLCGPRGQENLQARQFWGALLTVHNDDPATVMRVRTY